MPHPSKRARALMAGLVVVGGVGGGVVISGRPNGPSLCPVATVGALDGPDPWGTCWPGPQTTGVPTGTTLTAYSGANPITANGTVVDGKTIPCIEIQATGIVIKNSKIVCSSEAVFVADASGRSLTIQDSEIDCGGNPPGGSDNSTAIGEAHVTALRVNIHGCENGADVNEEFSMQDSYIHDLRQCGPSLCGGDGSHTDGLQIPGRASDAGALNVTVRHNTIISMGIGATIPDTTYDDPNGHWTTSAIISGIGPDQNVHIDHNLLAGGAFTLYCRRPGSAVSADYNDNHFSTQYKSTVGAFGPTSDCADENGNISGNVYHESGLPVTMD